jgi:hypothetical protein
MEFRFSQKYTIEIETEIKISISASKFRRNYCSIQFRHNFDFIVSRKMTSVETLAFSNKKPILQRFEVIVLHFRKYNVV